LATVLSITGERSMPKHLAPILLTISVILFLIGVATGNLVVGAVGAAGTVAAALIRLIVYRQQSEIDRHS
jgi:hypothetical protein